MELAISFLEGIITFISPCLLPMLPIYVSYFSGEGAGDRRKTLKNAIGFVVGFSIVFVALGAFAGGIGGLLLRHSDVVNVVAGAFIFFMGLKYLGVVKLRLPRLFKARGTMASKGNLTMLSAITFGITFAVLWTPCVTTFLGVALVRASTQGSAGYGMLMLFLYSLGLGIPFVMSAVLINQLKGAFDFIKRHYRVINMVSGGILLVIGVLVATGIFGRYLALFAV